MKKNSAAPDPQERNTTMPAARPAHYASGPLFAVAPMIDWTVETLQGRSSGRFSIIVCSL
ncbi:hypothetical protein ACP4J4_08835 [Aureimonas ureilytica]|uniref:hypothetical protein n=1 Tax=Aureimonas ureilytica TaxID=401562 RepID=UPI003CEF92AB